jgi:hypothetical protein
MTDDYVLPCRRCGAPAHLFTWHRACDGEAREQPLCDSESEALCVTCAVALAPEFICACQHCQCEHAKLRRRA